MTVLCIKGRKQQWCAILLIIRASITDIDTFVIELLNLKSFS